MSAVVRHGKVHRCPFPYKIGPGPDDFGTCTSFEGHRGDHQPPIARKGSPVVNFRVPSEVLAAARSRAATEGTTPNAVVVAALRRYGEGATA